MRKTIDKFYADATSIQTACRSYWSGIAASAVVATVAVGQDSTDLALGWRTGLNAAEAAVERAIFDGSDTEWKIQEVLPVARNAYITSTPARLPLPQ